jgi:hypothetical protein
MANVTASGSVSQVSDWLTRRISAPYKSGFAGAYAMMMDTAREFGDYEIADAALRALDQDCGRADDGFLRNVAAQGSTPVARRSPRPSEFVLRRSVRRGTGSDLDRENRA